MSLLMACGGDGEERLQERTAEGPSSMSSSAMSGAMTPTEMSASPSMESMESMVDLPPIDMAAVAAKVLEETVTEALAAAHAAEVGAAVCDAAYESAAELVRVVRERFPEEAHEMPPRELFVSMCEQLPREAQQCMVVRYAVEHEDECRRVQEALPEADRRRMEQLLRGE